MVWEDDISENAEILYRRSTDGGATFSSITYLTINAELSNDLALVASGDFVHVVWQDLKPGNSGIIYRRSTDG